MKFNMLKLPPQKYRLYHDYSKRELTITNIDIGNRLGREIQGTICADGKEDDYSCPLRTWEVIWRDKVPPIDSDKMIIG